MSGLSPHQKLAKSINTDTSTVVGGMFKRGSNGAIITDEFSGHFWRNWNDKVRKQFTDVMKDYGIKINHSGGM